MQHFEKCLSSMILKPPITHKKSQIFNYKHNNRQVKAILRGPKLLSPPFHTHTHPYNFIIQTPPFHTKIYTSWLLHFLSKPPPRELAPLFLTSRRLNIGVQGAKLPESIRFSRGKCYTPFGTNSAKHCWSTEIFKMPRSPKNSENV